MRRKKLSVEEDPNFQASRDWRRTETLRLLSATLSLDGVFAPRPQRTPQAFGETDGGSVHRTCLGLALFFLDTIVIPFSTVYGTVVYSTHYGVHTHYRVL